MPIPNLSDMNPTSWSWVSMKQHARSFGSRLTRTRPIEAMRDDRRKSIAVTKLPRCLTTLDLTSLGVGSCVGTGMYVVSGLVAKELAGPAVVLSFIIAGVASLLSGMCYAEFGVRVPKTSGSAYTYSYVTVGEFTAFFIGWNLILEYLIGTASGASALSSMMDSLSNRTIGKWMVQHLGNLPSIGGHPDPYSFPDIIAFLIVLAMTVIVAAGVRNSVLFNNALNAVNLIIWIFLVVCGLCFMDFSNWADGNFLPFGWNGVLSGAATCFYAYIGFDIIATTGEECQRPHKSIPYAILSSLCVCLTAYVTVSGLLTLVVPYYLINSESPLLEMFHHTSFPQAQYIITIGAVTSLTVSLLGSLFPMPRVIYAMASDGLLFRCLAHVFPYTETPAVATVVAGVIAAILALAISLRDLIEMMSIGTLLAYTLVSLSVLLLRYQHDVTVESGSVHFRHVGGETQSMSEPEEEIRPEDCETMETEEMAIGCDSDATGLVQNNSTKQKKSTYGAIKGNSSQADAERELLEVDKENICSEFWLPVKGAISYRWAIFTDYIAPWTYAVRTFLGLPSSEQIPTAETHKLADRYILLLSAYSVILNIFLVFGSHHISTGAWWAVILLMIMLVIFAFLLLKICQQPQNPKKLAYMTPAVPFLPVTAIWFNTYLMLRLSPLTWVRFVIWCIIGLFMYFGYGVWNSGLETPQGSSQETYEGGLDLEYNGIDNQSVGYQARDQNLHGVTVHQHLAKAEAVIKKQQDGEQLMEDYDGADGE
ncbi:solute carrier family 7 member 14-like [Styela clava]